MHRLASAILRLYPRAWRVRYRSEVEDILHRRRLRPGDLIDLARGAIDAQLHPQVRPVLQLAVPAASIATMATVPELIVTRPAYGVVDAPLASLVSRRSFMRRMLGVGAGILSLEFLGGSLAFLWPGAADGLGVEYRVGTLEEINARFPNWAAGTPAEFRPARAFMVNVPAATAKASGSPMLVAAPGADQILALWRKCPHLGCMIPAACDDRSRFQCYCHSSTYNILDEKLERGPAPRGMDRFPVRMDGDVVVIDTRELIKGPPKGVVTFRDPHPQNEGCA